EFFAQRCSRFLRQGNGFKRRGIFGCCLCRATMLYSRNQVESNDCESGKEKEREKTGLLFMHTHAFRAGIKKGDLWIRL
ncbi:MAG: hypothetical protein RBS08_05780, partial [Bdellovibrionales bacterium]|nr:hypothetical protein [Bdellovibrionales bacterium]